MSVKELALEELSEFEIEREERVISFDDSVLNDVYIDLKVIAGTLAISVAELAKLSAGSMVKLEQPIDSPMELFYGDHLIADGVLVVAEDRLGIRITKVHYSHVVRQ